MSINKFQYRAFRLICNPEEKPLVEDLLSAQGFIFEPDPFLPLTQRLIKEPFPLGRSLAAFWGCIYIQDRSSILPVLALQPQHGDIILDMCASPGSKTSLLAQCIGNTGLVVGNEPTKTRLTTLRRNLSKLNVLNTVTSSLPAESIPLEDASWKKILLDPPCSGWGTTNKHPHVTKIWQGKRINPLISLQKTLLTEATRLLYPGGKVVYSTCTTNVDENEAIIQFAITTLGLKIIPLETSPGFSTTKPLLPYCEGTLRIVNTSDSQGFYIALLQKPHNAITAIYNKSYERLKPPPVSYSLDILTSFGIDIQKLPQGQLTAFNDIIYFLPQKALAHLPAKLYWQGPALGKISNNTLFPSPRLRIGITKNSMLPSLHIDQHKILEQLVQGQSLQTSLTGKEALLFWKDLPLGRIRLKNGRAFWTER